MNINLPQMTFINQILDNSILAWGLVACGLAQLMKLPIELIQKKQWRPGVLLETGGMPSSHSALVTGTASAIGAELGYDSSIFALATTIAFIVMYDASGIRKSAGLTSKRVNEIKIEAWNIFPNEPLKENLGHTKLEVLIGGLLGPTIAIPGIMILGSPLDLAEKVISYFG